jgi:hypothetical protein
VTERPPIADGVQRRARLKETARRVVTEAYLGGLELEELLKVIREVHRELEKERGEKS